MSGSRDTITLFINGKEAKLGNKVDPRMTLLQVRIIINYFVHSEAVIVSERNWIEWN
jgi:hypothetical protein